MGPIEGGHFIKNPLLTTLIRIILVSALALIILACVWVVRVFVIDATFIINWWTMSPIILITLLLIPIIIVVHRWLAGSVFQRVFFAEVIAFGILLTFIIGSLSFNTYYSAFNPTKWALYPEKRTLMIEKLFADYDFIDLSRKEVASLLGEPTKTAYFKNTNNLVYYLGPERGLMSVDSEWLIITFNEKDTVSKVEIKRD